MKYKGIELKEITELKAENERLRNDKDFTDFAERTDNQISEMDAEIRRLKRALWLARAKRAEARKDYWYARCCHEGDDRLWSIDGSPLKYLGCIKRTNFDWLKIWSEVECKCLKKAEKYK